MPQNTFDDKTTLGKNFSEILIEIYTSLFKKNAPWKWPFCLGLNVLVDVWLMYTL